MKHLVSKTALAVVLAALSLALPSTASAKDVQVQIDPNGVKLVQPCDPYYDDCDFDRNGRGRGGNDWDRGGPDRRGGDDDYHNDGYDRRWDDNRRDDDRYERHVVRFCSDNRALDKAERMGVRRAYIAIAGRRFVEVRGRNRDGRRVALSFGRAPGCPVIR